MAYPRQPHVFLMPARFMNDNKIGNLVFGRSAAHHQAHRSSLITPIGRPPQ